MEGLYKTMHGLRVNGVRYLILAVPVFLAAQAFGVSCTTESQMTAAQRSVLAGAARSLGAEVQAGNADAVRTQTIAPVAAQFGGIANTIETVSASIRTATLTVDGLYLLHATDLTGPQDAQFFCGIAASPLTVEITIPNLPPGEYALALLHATGVANPQRLSMVLSQSGPGSGWKLAGFFVRPMMMAGHDGVWYWRQARDYAAKREMWDAYFYYETAQYLLNPVDFLSSPNLEKLQRETEKARPGGLPGADPLQLTSGTVHFSVTGLHTGELGGQLDLVVTYEATPGMDPVQSRTQVLEVMHALLAQYPELPAAFHGLWVYAATPGNRAPFALELPIQQIEATPSPTGRSS